MNTATAQLDATTCSSQRNTDELPQNFAKTVIRMSGFGSKHELLALYVEGELLACEEARFLDEDESVYKKLALKLAKDAGYIWLERQAAAVWQRSYYVEPPTALAQYEVQTAQMFEALVPQDVFDQYALNGTEPREELRALHAVYLLSGGKPENADEAVARFVDEQGGFFSSVNEGAYDVVQLGRLPGASQAKFAAAQEASKKLQVAWAERMQALWRAPKAKVRHCKA